jgi:hypothetical protein
MYTVSDEEKIRIMLEALQKIYSECTNGYFDAASTSERVAKSALRRVGHPVYESSMKGWD